MPELQTSDAFEWVRYPWGQALRCRPLAAVAQHCFTTRQPVIPSGDGTNGDGWHNIAHGFGVPREGLVRLRQVHGAGVMTIRTTDVMRASIDEWGAADAAVTDSADVALTVRVADCVPVLIGDRRTGAVAAVHAGWRGAASGVIPATVRSLASAFLADPADLVAAVGPSIGPCCYRVGPELRDRFLDAGHSADAIDGWFTASPPILALRGVPGSEPVSPDGRPPLWLNMWSVVSDQLALAGLATENVHVAGFCTSCARDVFHSYRVDGPGAGRMVGVIRVRE
ncbi:MAG: peptidoglycan editing factor PgeF [Acidobacteria bacterium]|nr:peptidoglycan editing factor PgeF [Acidobacteriota bacterium]